jgi:hypothetical protein
MPDTEISKLPPLTKAQIQADDVLPIADISAVETKKVKTSDLVLGAFERAPDGSINPNKLDWSQLDSDSISGDDLADGSIADEKLIANTLTARSIAPNAIGASELANNAVDTGAIANRAVTGAKVALSTLDSSHIVDGGIDTDAIGDGEVTYAKLTINDGEFPGEKLVSNSVTATQLAPNSVNASELANNAVDTAAINNQAVTGAKVASSTLDSSHIVDGGIDTDAIGDGEVTYRKLTIDDWQFPGAKLVNNSVTATQLAANSVGSSELADSSVDTAAIQVGAVDNGALATNSVDDRVIQNSGVSNANLSAASVTVDKLSLNDNDLPGSVIADGTITTEELESDLPGTILVDAAIDTAKLGNLSVTESKIVDSSVTSNKVANASITDAKIVGVNGTKITDATVGPVKFTNDTFGRGISNNGANVGIDNSVSPATTSGISYNGQGLITGSVPIVGPDLPPATASEIGAISVPPGSGLTVSELGAIDHLTLVSAATRSGISYDEHGHITNTVALIGTDLPTATTNQIGAVSIPTANNNPLTVDVAGQLRHEVTGFAATDSLASVNVDVFGHVTGGSTQLIPSQVPPLDASIINSGQFDNARIANDAITKDKLADYSISFIQEAEPTNLTGVHAGMLWYQESTGQLRLYNLNSWMPVGFGRLAQDNLRFCGTVNATTGLVTTLTDNGRTAGFTVGEVLPTATDPLSGTYLVVETAGSNIGVVPATAFDEGDWVLAIDAAAGWIRIDSASGAGGGSALLRLNDLLDVDINSPQPGDALFYDPNTNNWSNQTTETTRITINEPFDGARTSFTLQKTVDSVNATALVLSGVLQEPGVDYNVLSGTNNMTFSSPPAEGSDYFMMSQAVKAGGGGGGGGGTSLPPGTAENEYLQWNNALGAWAPSTELSGGTY